MSSSHMTRSLLREVFLEVCRREESKPGEVARAVGVQGGVLSARLRELERKGLVEWREGKKKIAVDSHFGYVVGIDLGGSHLHFALADFAGEIQHDSTIKIRPEDGPRKMIGQIQQGVHDLAALGKYGRLRAIGISVPSAVDAEKGVVAWANNLPGWTNIHLGHALEKEFHVPVSMENDANLAAVGEHWRGVARGVDNFVFVAIGTGIGSGVFIDGKLYRGRSGWAGELFRMNVDWPRWQEEFVDTGQFESLVAGLGIAAEAHKVLGAEAQGEAKGLAQERDAFFAFDAYRKGNPQAREVLEKVFTILGVGLANVVAVLDPELIVLGGGIARGAPELMLATVEKVVRAIQKDITPPFKFSALEDKAQTFGAIFAALSVAREAIAKRL